MSRFSRRNLTLRELARERCNDPEFQRRRDPITGAPTEFNGEPLMTAFHPGKGIRVILDGNHRAVIISNERKETGVVPTQKIMECFGNMVQWIFAYDYSRIP